MLVSFHMISKRKEVIVERKELEVDYNVLEEQTNQLMRRVALRDIHDLSMSQTDCSELKALAAQYYDDDEEEEGGTVADEDDENILDEEQGGGGGGGGDGDGGDVKSRRRRPTRQWNSDDSYIQNLGVPTCDRNLTKIERLKKWVSKPCKGDKCQVSNDSIHQVSEKMGVVGETFFEYFLDGSAGVMYTSFLGLILSELISRYGREYSCSGGGY